MYDDGKHRRRSVGPDHVEIRLPNDGVAVASTELEPRRVSIADHREDVVRRLLSRGLSPRLLRAILPEFRALIERLVRH